VLKTPAVAEFKKELNPLYSLLLVTLPNNMQEADSTTHFKLMTS